MSVLRFISSLTVWLYHVRFSHDSSIRSRSSLECNEWFNGYKSVISRIFLFPRRRIGLSHQKKLLLNTPANSSGEYPSSTSFACDLFDQDSTNSNKILQARLPQKTRAICTT